MRMDLQLSYDDTPEDLNVADLLLMDLDETSSDIRVRIDLESPLAEDLAKAFKAFHDKDGKLTLREYLASRLPQYYEFRHYKVAKDGTAEAIAPDQVSRLIEVDLSASTSFLLSATWKTKKVLNKLPSCLDFLTFTTSTGTKLFNLTGTMRSRLKFASKLKN